MRDIAPYINRGKVANIILESLFYQINKSALNSSTEPTPDDVRVLITQVRQDLGDEKLFLTLEQIIKLSKMRLAKIEQNAGERQKLDVSKKVVSLLEELIKAS